MAWNQPGGGNDNDKDPWTGKSKPSGPPDLEAALRDLRKKLVQLFTNKTGSSGHASFPNKIYSSGLSGLIAIAIFFVWVLSGIFIVDPAEQAVILRLGQYVETVGPGPHWIARFIEKSYRVNEQKIATYSYDAEMLTKDENIVSVAIAVQYRISNARDYLFSVTNPNESLQQATASALRQVIGHTNLEQVLTSGREKIRQEIFEQITKILARYKTGLLVTDVALQPAKAPEAVKEAFDDAIKAQEDEQRFENQAQAYAMQVVPNAKGQAQRLVTDAKAHQQQVVLNAKAEVARFLALLPVYSKSTAITRERLYLETMETILSNSNTILIDNHGSNNMFYLPLDKLLEKVTKPTATTINPANPMPTSNDITGRTERSNTSITLPTGGYE